MKIDLNVSNFCHYFIFNPRSDSLSACDKRIATVLSWTLGIVSLGSVPLFSWLFLYDKSYIVLKPKDVPIVNSLGLKALATEDKKNYYPSPLIDQNVSLNHAKKSDTSLITSTKDSSSNIIPSLITIASPPTPSSTITPTIKKSPPHAFLFRSDPLLEIMNQGEISEKDFEKILQQRMREGMDINILVNASHTSKKWIESGGTILFEAWSKNSFKYIHILKENGLDFSIQDGSWRNTCLPGNTALISAIADANNLKAVEILKLTADGIDVQDNFFKNTALHLAVGKGYTTVSAHGEHLEYSNFEIVKMLVQKGANPNLINKFGNTPLHLAFLRRDLDMIVCLIEHGAELDIKNHEGNTPIDLLDTNYINACEIIRETVFVYLLDKSAFEKNLNKIHDFLQARQAPKDQNIPSTSDNNTSTGT